MEIWVEINVGNEKQLIKPWQVTIIVIRDITVLVGISKTLKS